MIKTLVFTRGPLKQPIAVIHTMDGRVEHKELSPHELRLRMLELAELLVETSEK